MLPFQNRSDAATDRDSADGMHDDILTQLAKIAALKVIARTSVERFRDTRLTTRQIGTELGVRTVLEGGVQRVGDRVRINVQLIDARDDAHLWAETYDRVLTAANVFAIQSEVAAAVAAALETTLTPAEQRRVEAVPTRSLEALGRSAYQLGQQRLARRTTESLAEAKTFFERAIDADPRFALAQVGLAETMRLQIGYSGAPRAETLERVAIAVERALALSPDLPDALVCSGPGRPGPRSTGSCRGLVPAGAAARAEQCPGPPVLQPLALQPGAARRGPPPRRARRRARSVVGDHQREPRRRTRRRWPIHDRNRPLRARDRDRPGTAGGLPQSRHGAGLRAWSHRRGRSLV